MTTGATDGSVGTASPRAPGHRRGGTIVVAVALAVLAAGVALRVWITTGGLGTLNADEVVSGLMARALLDGDASVFFWGQAYGGSLETVPFAVLLAITGPTVAIHLLPLLEAALVGILLYVVVRRRLDAPLALAVVALTAVFPAAAVWFSTRPMLFYQPALLCGLVVVLLAEQLVDGPDRGRRWRWLLLGVAAGIGWWTSAQVLFFVVPAVWWIVTRRAVRSWRDVGLAAGGAVLGALPWLAYNLVHRGRSLRELPEGDGGYVDHVRAQLERGWPMTFGLRRPFDERWVVDGGAVVLAVVALAAAALVGVVFVRHRALRSPLAGVLLAFPVLHALAPTGSFVGNGRYYVFVVPSLAYVVVAAISTLRRHEALTAGVLLAATALTTVTLVDLRDTSLGPTGTTDVADVLADRGIRHVYANYWIAYPLAWADDDVRVSPDHAERRPDWSREVRRAPGAAYVFWLPYDVDAARYAELVPRLRAQVGVREELEVGDYRIVVPMTNVPPERLTAAAAEG